ncbi:MAG TPA: hotdog domain-containing protein [Actinomycetota bacterium]
MDRTKPVVGDEASLEVTVTDEMLVDLGGRRIHPLYATAWMVRHAEEAARMLIEPHFGPNEDATGYSVSVLHERPARTGDRLTVTAQLSAIDDRECTTDVVVDGPGGRVGTATVVQRYIEAGRFTDEEEDA